jgi:hypothetical protein
MTQQLIVTTDASVDLKPLIESAIRAELRMLEIGLERTRQRLRAFEAHYGYTSEEFARRFEARELDESLDFFEWAGEIKAQRLLEDNRDALRGVHLN